MPGRLNPAFQPSHIDLDEGSVAWQEARTAYLAQHT